MNKYNVEKISEEWIQKEIVKETIKFAEKFGQNLANASDSAMSIDRNGKLIVKVKRVRDREIDVKRSVLTTSQLRRFFGEVKRQQAKGFEESEFLLLKPKLAYAVARAKDEDAKINDFYYVISDAIDKVRNKEDFARFIKIFEAIVAYHRAAEDSNLVISNN